MKLGRIFAWIVLSLCLCYGAYVLYVVPRILFSPDKVASWLKEHIEGVSDLSQPLELSWRGMHWHIHLKHLHVHQKKDEWDVQDLSLTLNVLRSLLRGSLYVSHVDIGALTWQHQGQLSADFLHDRHWTGSMHLSQTMYALLAHVGVIHATVDAMHIKWMHDHWKMSGVKIDKDQDEIIGSGQGCGTYVQGYVSFRAKRSKASIMLDYLRVIGKVHTPNFKLKEQTWPEIQGKVDFILHATSWHHYHGDIRFHDAFVYKDGREALKSLSGHLSFDESPKEHHLKWEHMHHQKGHLPDVEMFLSAHPMLSLSGEHPEHWVRDLDFLTLPFDPSKYVKHLRAQYLHLRLRKTDQWSIQAYFRSPEWSWPSKKLSIKGKEVSVEGNLDQGVLHWQKPLSVDQGHAFAPLTLHPSQITWHRVGASKIKHQAQLDFSSKDAQGHLHMNLMLDPKHSLKDIEAQGALLHWSIDDLKQRMRLFVKCKAIEPFGHGFLDHVQGALHIKDGVWHSKGHAHISQMTLHLDQKWQVLSKMKGGIQWENGVGQWHGEAYHQNILLKPISVKIEKSSSEPKVHVHLVSHFDLKDAVHAMRLWPIDFKLSNGQGKGQLHLSYQQQKGQSRYQGQLRLHQASMSLPHQLKVHHVHGSVTFNEQGVGPLQMFAQMNHSPFSLSREQWSAPIKMKGALGTKDVCQLTSKQIGRIIQGQIPFKGQMDIDDKTHFWRMSLKLQPDPHQCLKENLNFLCRGPIQVNLHQKDQQHVQLSWSGDEHVGQVMIGKRAQIQSARIGLGTSLPKREKMPFVISMHLKHHHFRAPKWQWRWYPLHVMAWVDDLEWAKLHWSHAQLDAMMHSHHYGVLKFKQKNAQGTLQMRPNGPWHVTFKHLNWPRSAHSNPQAIHFVHPLEVDAHDLTCFNHHYDHAKLSMMSDHQGGVNLEKITLDDRLWHGKGKGFYRKGSWGLNAHVETDSLGDLMASYGQQYGLSGGKGAMVIHGHGDCDEQSCLRDPWVSIDFDMENGLYTRLSEQVSSKLGLGRMMSALSVHSILRHLSTQFNDLVGKGYHYDHLEGQVLYAHHRLESKSLILTGNAANVLLSGHVDLVAKTYHMLVGVQTALTSSLPTLAALAGGPAMGAITWVADRLVLRQLPGLTLYAYRVKGPWDHPMIESLNMPGEQA